MEINQKKQSDLATKFGVSVNGKPHTQIFSTRIDADNFVETLRKSDPSLVLAVQESAT